MTNKEIKEGRDNDRIIRLILAERIQQARDKQSLKGVCKDLGLDCIQDTRPLRACPNHLFINSLERPYTEKMKGGV